MGPVKKKATDEDFRKAGEELMTKGTRSMFLASDDDESSDPDRTSHVAFRKALERKTGPSIMTSTNLGAASSFAPSLTPGKKKKKKARSCHQQGKTRVLRVPIRPIPRSKLPNSKNIAKTFPP